MNIHVRYFARLREKLGTDQEQLALPAGAAMSPHCVAIWLPAAASGRRSWVANGR